MRLKKLLSAALPFAAVLVMLSAFHVTAGAEAIIKVGDTEYETVSAAMDHIYNTKTVELLADIELISDENGIQFIEIPGEREFIPNGHKITITNNEVSVSTDNATIAQQFEDVVVLGSSFAGTEYKLLCYFDGTYYRYSAQIPVALNETTGTEYGGQSNDYLISGLQNAINSAAAGDTIKLIRDIENSYQYSLAFGGDYGPSELTLDLNGHNLYKNYVYTSGSTTSAASRNFLNIYGSLKLINTASEKAKIYTVTDYLNPVTIYGGSLEVNENIAIYAEGIEADNDASHPGTVIGTTGSYRGDLVINGGEIGLYDGEHTNYSDIEMYKDSTVVINSGKVYNDVYCYPGSATMNGGTVGRVISKNVEITGGIANGLQGWISTISGGYVGKLIFRLDIVTSPTLSISGGKFGSVNTYSSSTGVVSADINDYIVEGYAAYSISEDVANTYGEPVHYNYEVLPFGEPSVVFTEDITDAGYCAEAADSEERTGALAVTVGLSEFENLTPADIKSCGFFYWKTTQGDVGTQKSIALSADAPQFYTVVYDITNYDQDIFILPYVILNDGTTVLRGNSINHKLSQLGDIGDKWLGTVDTMLANVGLSR